MWNLRVENTIIITNTTIIMNMAMNIIITITMRIRVITLEQDILRRNNLLAERNRGYFEAKEIFCLNLMSSPGSGKTTLLEETVPPERQTPFVCRRGRPTDF